MPEEQPKFVSNQQLQLELRALRSDVKYWVLGAVVANQALSAVNMPETVTFGALAVFGGKILLGLVTRG